MTCEELDQILQHSPHRASWHGWMLMIAREALVRSHVQSCPSCATKMAEISRLEASLAQFRISTASVEAPPSVEKKLLDAFRENATKRPPINIAFSWKPVFVAAATLVLAASSILLHSKLRPGSVLNEETNKNHKALVISPHSVPGVSSTAALAMGEQGSATPENSAINPRHRSATQHPTTERGRNPKRLAASDVLSLNGGGSVVRVTLPFSSLVAIGVPVRPDLSESRVTADVWMDPFGAVVGVRLVLAKARAD